MKAVQFELFPDCTQLCKFCYCTNLKTSDEVKIDACKKVLEFIENGNILEYDIASLIGGEYFQDIYSESVTKYLELVLVKLLELYKTRKLKGIWLNTTFTRHFNELTIKYLELFNDASKNIENNPKVGAFICTSWDHIGRFHTEKQRDIWDYNMKFLTKNYPNFKKSIAIILTEEFMKMYLDSDFSLTDFSQKYSASIFLKQPFVIYEDGYTVKPRDIPNFVNKKDFNTSIGYNFYPYRETALNFFYKLAQKEPTFLAALFTIGKRANELVKCWGDDIYIENRFTEGKVEISGNITLNDKCGHTYSYQSYVDSDSCIRCDRDAVYEATFGERFID